MNGIANNLQGNRISNVVIKIKYTDELIDSVNKFNDNLEMIAKKPMTSPTGRQPQPWTHTANSEPNVKLQAY